LLIRETADLRIAYAGPLKIGAREMTETMKYFAAATGTSAQAKYMAKGALT
jgi:hypothetical protein